MESSVSIDVAFVTIRFGRLKRLKRHACSSFFCGPARAGQTAVGRLGFAGFSETVGPVRVGRPAMLLLPAHAFGQLQSELIRSLGADLAQGVLKRYGYQAGFHDGHWLCLRHPGLTIEEQIHLGMLLHERQGMARVEALASTSVECRAGGIGAPGPLVRFHRGGTAGGPARQQPGAGLLVAGRLCVGASQLPVPTRSHRGRDGLSRPGAVPAAPLKRPFRKRWKTATPVVAAITSASTCRPCSAS